jgi:hypothetical protein
MYVGHVLPRNCGAKHQQSPKVCPPILVECVWYWRVWNESSTSMAHQSLLTTSIHGIWHGFSRGHATTTDTPSHENRDFNSHNGKQKTSHRQVSPHTMRSWYRLQCTDGSMGQKEGILKPYCRTLMQGIIFIQPDMLQSSRICLPDFELKVGYAVILLEYRIQQSPKTHLYTL